MQVKYNVSISVLSIPKALVKLQAHLWYDLGNFVSIRR